MPFIGFAQRPTRYQTVQVDMLAEVLSPGMQHSSHAQVSIQSFWISCKGLERMPYNLEHLVINYLRVQLYPAIEFMWQGKHQVMIGDRQNVPLLTFTPPPGGPRLALRAMSIPTPMIQGELIVAVVALIRDTTQCRRVTAQQMPAYPEAMHIQLVGAEILSKVLLQKLLDSH